MENIKTFLEHTPNVCFVCIILFVLYTIFMNYRINKTTKEVTAPKPRKCPSIETVISDEYRMLREELNERYNSYNSESHILSRLD